MASRDEEVRQLEAALLRWRSLILLGDLQRRAYLEQGEQVDEDAALYRNVAFRFAEEIQRLRARVAELEALITREEP